MRITLVLFFLAESLCSYAQLIHSISLDRKPPLRHNFLVDSNYFAVFQEYASHTSFLLLKNGEGKVSDLNYGTPSEEYDGFSTDEEKIYVYFHEGSAKPGFIPKWKVASLYKDSRSPEVNDLIFPGLPEKGMEGISFTRNNTNYRIFKDNKAKALKVYEVNGLQASKIGTFPLSRDAYKIIRKRSFTFIEEHGNISLDVLHDNKVYWSGDSLVLAYRETRMYDKYYLVSLNLSKGAVFEREIYSGDIVNSINEFLLQDKLFVLASDKDSLVLEIKKLKSLETVRRIKMDEATGIPLKNTPYLTTKGDTLESDWKAEKKTRMLLKAIHNGVPFISAKKESSGHYTVTIGSQIIIQSAGSMNMVGGMPVVTYGGGSYFGGQEYFKGCLSEEFKPLPCQHPITLQDKILKRKNELEEGVKTSVLFTADRAYLLYIIKKTKTLNIEEFN